MWGIGIDPKPGLENHDYMELYSVTAHTLKNVSARLKVGGTHTLRTSDTAPPA
jgi:hypothetical protein